MEWISHSNILIVGLGLMGGSYAKALKRLGFHVMAIDTRKDAIDFAVENKIIDRGSSDNDINLISDADAVIFALYPGAFKSWIEENQKNFKSGIYITDVTGVKAPVVYEIQGVLRDDVEFIAAHPMAGRETSGVEHADNSMFIGANYIVTPTKKNTKAAIEWCKSLGRVLGCTNITELSPEEHDQMIGFVSQLTHVVAVSLMNANDNHHLADYTGDSFRDLTRIARINETMWSELFLLNKKALLEQMDSFIDQINEIRDMIEHDDREGLCQKMITSTTRRAWFDKP